MAERIWIGGSSGYENTWNHAANWAGGVVPAPGDDVYLVETTHAIAGFDASATALASVNVAASMTGNIGSSSSRLRLRAERLRFDGRQAAAWIELGNGGADITEVQVSGTKSTTAPITEGLHLSALDHVPVIYLRDGSMTIEADGAGTIGTVFAMGGSHRLLKACAALENMGANCTLAAGVTSVRNHAGTSVASGAATAADVTITAGAVRWNAAGDITNELMVFGGTFDASANPHAFTINAVRVFNGVVECRAGLGQPMFSTPPRIHGRQGVIYVDAGRPLTIG